jgi:hypothetical protein
MNGDCSGERTSATLNDQFVFALYDFGDTANRVQYLHSTLYTFPKIRSGGNLCGHRPSNCTKHRLDLRRTQTGFENRDQLVE